jgi:antitoxin VapB
MARSQKAGEIQEMPWKWEFAMHTLTMAVVVALRERLARLRGRSKRRRLCDELREIARRCAQLPTLDHRADEEILGYAERGLPR